MSTLTLKELGDYRNFVGRAWLDFELRATKLNNVGSKDSMEEGNELMIYYYLLTQMGDYLFFDNNYKDRTGFTHYPPPIIRIIVCLAALRAGRKNGLAFIFAVPYSTKRA